MHLTRFADARMRLYLVTWLRLHTVAAITIIAGLAVFHSNLTVAFVDFPTAHQQIKGMLDVQRRRRCEGEDCSRQPCFALEGEPKPRYTCY
jgi:hypothetical protein